MWVTTFWKKEAWKMTVNKALLTLVTLLLGGCNGMQIEDFRQTQPEFILEDYFQGNTRAWGLFEDRFGNIQRQFVVDINGTWDGSTLVLNEDFIYNDGAGENRVWSVTKTGDKTYQGTTEHVVGAAVGTREGNAFNWNYEFNLQVGDDVMTGCFCSPTACCLIQPRSPAGGLNWVLYSCLLANRLYLKLPPNHPEQPADHRQTRIELLR
jgi:hypothetical protein